MVPQKKIDRLTPEQELRFADMKRQWSACGMSTRPADRPSAEAAIHEIYRAADLAPPKKIVWCGSPYVQAIARAIVADPEFLDNVVRTLWKSIRNGSGDGIRDDVRATFGISMRIVDGAAVKRGIAADLKSGLEGSMDKYSDREAGDGVREKIRECTWDCVLDIVWKGVEHGVRRNRSGQGMAQSIDEGIREQFAGSIGVCVKQRVWTDVRDSAWNRIGECVGGRARTSVWDKLWSRIQEDVWDRIAIHVVNALRTGAFESVTASGYGQHDAHWLAFYACFREVGGLASETENLSGLMALAKSAGWFLPHEHICWVAERPCVLSTDGQGRLHCSSGPALAYPDGWHIHAIHGMRVRAEEVEEHAATDARDMLLVGEPG